MLLMVGKGIRRGICHSIYRYAKTNNKYMKYYDKNNNLSYFQYLRANNLYGWEMLQKLGVNNFKWIKDTSYSNNDFINNQGRRQDLNRPLEDIAQNFDDGVIILMLTLLSRYWENT